MRASHPGAPASAPAVDTRRRNASIALVLAMALLLVVDVRTLASDLLSGAMGEHGLSGPRPRPPGSAGTAVERGPKGSPSSSSHGGGGLRPAAGLKGRTWRERAEEAGVPTLEVRAPAWAEPLLEERGPAVPGTPPADLPYYGEGWSAQEAEDRRAFFDYFFNLVDGTILELGALDGDLFSTSKYYERYLGWRAVHIEAGTGNFRNLTRNRPNALNIHAACCSQRRDVHVVEGGAVGGILEFMSPGFRDPWWPQYSNPETWAALPSIPCLPLQTLLDIFGITHIDFFVLDVEGAELEVLRSLDLTRLTIDVAVVEAESRDAESDRRIADIKRLFEDAGYIVDELGSRNMWVARSGFIPSMQRG